MKSQIVTSKTIISLLLLMLIPLSVNSTDLSGSLSLRTPREGNLIDWQMGAEIKDEDNLIWLAWERENGRPERERLIKISCPDRWWVFHADEMVKTARRINEQKVGVLYRGNISIGVSMSWLRWKQPRPVMDLLAKRKWQIVQGAIGYSTDFGKRQTASAELRIEQPVSRRFKVGVVGRYFHNQQGESFQGKATAGIAL